MAEMTIEQKKALARARARLRVQQPSAASAPPVKGSISDSIMQGLTFGFSDEMVGGLGGAIEAIKGGSFNEGYETVRDRARAKLKEYQNRAPVASTVGEVIGAIPTAIIPGGAAARGASMASKIGRGALTAAGYGGLHGVGVGETAPERIAGGILGAGTGAVIGGVAPVAGAAVSKAASKTISPFLKDAAVRKTAPSADVLRSMSRGLYKAAENEKVRIRPEAIERIARAVTVEGRRAGADPQVTPKAWGVIRRLQREAGSGRPVRLEHLDTLRQVAAGALDENSAASAAMFGKITDVIDNLGPQDVFTRDPRMATRILRDARELWRRQGKTQTLMAAIENAGNAPSGLARGLESEFRKLIKVNPRTGKPVYKWTPDEKAAIEAVVQRKRGATLLGLLGQFGVPIDTGRGFLGMVLGAGTGAAIGSAAGVPLVGMAAIPALGTAAKVGEHKIMEGLANTAVGTTALGGRIPAGVPMLSGGETASGIIGRSLLPAFIDAPKKQPALELNVPIGGRIPQ